MTSVSYIITAKHYAERERCVTVCERILKRREMMHKKNNIALQVLGLDAPSGQTVRARIWQGQWIGDCECGGAEFVEPSEPIFYCFSCGNRGNNNRVRPVEFPVQREEIEAAVLARPVNDMRGLTDMERAGLARAAVVVVVDGVQLPLVRSWLPDESLEELLQQNAVLNGLVVEAGNVVVVDLDTHEEQERATRPADGSAEEVSDVV